MALEKGMYGHEFDSPKKPRFGIRCGQMRSKETVHNGSWFNRKGQKLGWGDSNDGDITRIANELELGEIFVVVNEHDSYWNNLELTADRKGFKAKRPLDDLGEDFCREKCSWVILPGAVCRVTRYGTERKVERLSTGQVVSVILREDVITVF